MDIRSCNIAQAMPIPLGDLPKLVHDPDSTDEIVAHSKTGMHSAEASDFLKQAGFRMCAHEGRNFGLEQ